MAETERWRLAVISEASEDEGAAGLVRALLPPPFVVVEGMMATARTAAMPEEVELVARAVPKRREEFACGRTFARAALAKLGITAGSIAMDADAAPIWPANIVGSITHGAGYCAVAVAHRRDASAIGIDVEGAARVKLDLLSRILLRGEIARHVDGVPPDEKRRMATILFSAKEAFYKCQFPISRTRLDFHDAEIVAEMDRGTFRLELRKEAGPFARGTIFEGRFRCDRERVAAAVALIGAQSS